MQTTTKLTTTISSIIIATLATLFILQAEQATAQTPVTKIENASSDSVFVSFDDGALLGLGEFTTGVIPASGAGTRMMWYPAKAAFRAGRVSSTQWDDANIGNYSVAMGYNTTASGNYSTAMGRYTAAATDNSLSIGENNSANSSADNTLFVAGNGTYSTPSDALVLDQDAGLVVKGELNTGVIPASGTGTRMMWYPGKAAFRAGEVDGSEWDDANIGNRSVAMGSNTTASGYQAVAMGYNTTASGPNSMAMGTSTTSSGDYSFAIGRVTTASATQSTAIGNGTTAATESSLSIGEYNSANTSDDGTLFVVGNGTSSTPSDALVLDYTGDMTIAGTLTESSDRRLKKNITSLEDGMLDKLDAITPSQFLFKNQQTHPAGQQIGLIAQEVQQQFPELVNKGTNGYLSVSYSKFTAVLLKGLQEQRKQLKQQRTTNKKQAQQITSLQKQLNKLEQNNQRTAGLPLPTAAILCFLLMAGGLAWKIA